MIMNDTKHYEPSLANTSDTMKNQDDWKDDTTSTIMKSDEENVNLLKYNSDIEKEMMNRDLEEIGILSDYCQHDNIVEFDLRPKAMSFSGLDMIVSMPEPDGSMKKSKSKESQPFYIQGKKLITATLEDEDHKLLYSMHQKWTSIKTSYYAKNVEGKKVLEVKDDKCFKFNLNATFNNHSNNQEIKLSLKTGLFTKINELRDEKGQLIGIIQRPTSKAKMGLPNECYRVKIAPKVDSTLVLLICMAMHTQLLTFKVATYGAPTAAAGLIASATSK